MDADGRGTAVHPAQGPGGGGTAEPALHGSFTVELDLAVPRSRVFQAFAEAPLRRRWFRLPGPSATAEHELDFRVGGGEVARNVFVSGGTEEPLVYRSRFLDIVPDTRIVHAYVTEVDGLRRWASLVTVELSDAPGGSRLTWTEQYTYLVWTGDGAQDVAHLRGGTRLVLNGLTVAVTPAAAGPVPRA
ncbi:SRPBCC domain-containing protein [Streptomyces sp. NPDC021224]|uniref:SRPBCC domain-containing protein n=1 Tax=unclassified Streptomyces TaxID=2593676 RepID=UPI0037B8733A